MAAATHVSSEGGRFAIVPEWIILRNEPQPLRLYAWLASRYADREGVAYPSRARLATELGITTKTIDRALAALELNGSISVERRRTTGGDSDTNVYRLARMRSNNKGATPVSLGGDTDVPTGGDIDVLEGRDTDVALTRPIPEPEPLEPERPWVVLLKELSGYRSHPRMVDAIELTCQGAGVEVGAVVAEFILYWPVGRVKHAWRDPLAALSRTIDVQIRKQLSSGRSSNGIARGYSQTDRERLDGHGWGEPSATASG